MLLSNQYIVLSNQYVVFVTSMCSFSQINMQFLSNQHVILFKSICSLYQINVRLLSNQYVVFILGKFNHRNRQKKKEHRLPTHPGSGPRTRRASKRIIRRRMNSVPGIPEVLRKPCLGCQTPLKFDCFCQHSCSCPKLI